MKGYRISVLRHGMTEANEKGIYIGKTDVPLSDKGAAELAAKMDEGRKKAYFYKDSILPEMAKLRKACDELELLVDKRMWPFPTYEEVEDFTTNGYAAARTIVRPRARALRR